MASLGSALARSVATVPGIVHPVADEREGLLAYLAQRYAIRIAAYGRRDHNEGY
jgi:hypothetical protein